MQIVLVVTFISCYSAITDLTFGDLYGHIKTENALFLSLFSWGIAQQVKTCHEKKEIVERSNLVFIWSH